MAFEMTPSGAPGAARILPFKDRGGARLAFARNAGEESVVLLNQILADTMAVRDLYKKHRWETSGAAFYQLHLLFDRHHGQQEELADAIAERIQTLGGVAIAMAADVAETTAVARPPRDRENPLQQLARLIQAHERVLYGVRAAARRAAELGDDGTSDLLVSDVMRTNEKQTWRVREQLLRGRRPLGS
jgi:starvation-inducible DNA-binding protein